MKTIDGGATWMNLPIPQGFQFDQFNSVYFPTANKGYIVANGGDILKTVDGGMNWTGDSSGTWNRLHSVFFTDSTTGYIAGESGTILKTGNEVVTFVKEPKPERANFIIYPNPANNKITITSTNMPPENILVTIYNTNGNQVMNEQFRDQTQVELDVSTLLKGIYLLKIQSKEGLEAKKLVIN
jgi:hypothetical protein